MANPETKNCPACDAKVTCNAGMWNVEHRACPKRGEPVADPCPECKGSMEWVVGKYSTFRACSNGKYFSGTCPGKIGAPRGQAAQKAPEAIPLPLPSTAVVSDAGQALYTLIQNSVRAEIETRAREIAQEIVANAPQSGPQKIEWTVNGNLFAKVEGTTHKALPKMIAGLKAGFNNFWIVGPAGSGKTTLASDLAKALGRRFASISCSGGMSESALTGRLIPNLTTGKTDFQSTQFVDVYESGGVFLLDEVDAADSNVLLTINSALANGHMPLPNRADNPAATRHPDTIIVCAANTYGTGADRQYVGRNQLDGAFNDRFCGTTIPVDYDRDLETALVGDAQILSKVWSIREKVADLKLRRIVGTRFLIAVAKWVKVGGLSIPEALEACTEGWTADEKSKAGI